MAKFQDFLAMQGLSFGKQSAGLPGGGFLTFAPTDAITAHAGGGQASAVQLTTQLNTVTVVATAGDSVKLPTPTITNIAPAGPQDNLGNMVIVNNQGANILAVFPDSGGTINGGSANASVNVASGEIAIFYQTVALTWWTGVDAGKIFSNVTLTGLLFESFAATITAHAGGGQSSAVALTAQINRVNVVATQGDSVALPASQAGLAIMVLNRGANPMQVFGAGTDTINGIATATGISQGINTTAIFVCNVAGNWEVPITSMQSTAPQVIGTASPALPPHVGHTYVFNRAGVTGATLAAPTAGTDDGIEITVTSSTANAHTITATGLLATGAATVNVATFAAHPGAGLSLMAYNGFWNVISSVGITFS